MAQNAKTQKAQLKPGKAATLKKLFFDPQKICLLVAFEDHHLCQLAPCNLAHGLLFHHPHFHRSLHALHALHHGLLHWQRHVEMTKRLMRSRQSASKCKRA